MKTQRRLARILSAPSLQALSLPLVMLLLQVATSGCGPSQLPVDVVQRVEAWPEAPRGQVLLTRHFALHTTIEQPRRQRELAAALEAAHARFVELVPEIEPLSPRRYDTYVFASRREWEDFTRRHVPDRSEAYLRIHRGGYTIEERAVLYDIGQTSTISVAVHEAWHQFCSRRFSVRLPPALEEGLAGRFERVRFVDGRAELVEEPSPSRLTALRSMLRDGRVLPLRELLSMHAGDVLGSSRGKVEAFYAQSWALADFLLRGDDEQHAEPLKRMLLELSMSKPTGEPWQPERGVKLFERHFGKVEAIEPAFRRFMARQAQR
jgi:hypothetical protein